MLTVSKSPWLDKESVFRSLSTQSLWSSMSFCSGPRANSSSILVQPFMTAVVGGGNESKSDVSLAFEIHWPKQVMGLCPLSQGAGKCNSMMCL